MTDYVYNSIDFKWNASGQSFIIPEGWNVEILHDQVTYSPGDEVSAEKYARQKVLRRPGLYGDDLVCRGAEDQGVEPGDVGSTCKECGTAVAVCQGDIELFGREPRPRILCRDCGTPEVDFEWTTINVPSIDFATSWTTDIEKFKKAFWGMGDAMKVSWEPKVKDFKSAVEKLQEVSAEGGSACRECGAFVKARGGQKVCKTCQRKTWRRT